MYYLNRNRYDNLVLKTIGKLNDYGRFYHNSIRVFTKIYDKFSPKHYLDKGVYWGLTFSNGIKIYDKGREIGNLGLFWRNENTVEIAYVIDQEYRGNGYIPSVIKYLQKNQFKDNIITLTIEPKNNSSIKVAQKCGFRLYETGRYLRYKWR